MTGAVFCRPITGPIRLNTRFDMPVPVRVLAAPVAVRVLGTPGPTGEPGQTGPAGPQGPPGNLDTGIVLDGGNF
jgi:hypothetical protein